MRMSVLSTMIMLYAPAIYYAHQYFYRKTNSMMLLSAMLCYPGLLYVDNGHFQYNHIPLALSLLAFVLFGNGRFLFGSILFVMALSFKQMSLFFALPVFVFLLFRSLAMGWKNGYVH
jgi:alpha-1,3-glucosyltransferase